MGNQPSAPGAAPAKPIHQALGASKPKPSTDNRPSNEDPNQYENLPDFDAPTVMGNTVANEAGNAQKVGTVAPKPVEAKTPVAPVAAKAPVAPAAAKTPVAPAAAPAASDGGVVNTFWAAFGWGATAAPTTSQAKIRAPEDKKPVKWNNDNYQTLRMVPPSDQVFVKKTPSAVTPTPRPPQATNKMAASNDQNYQTLAHIQDPFQKKK